MAACLYAVSVPSGHMKIGITGGDAFDRMRQLQVGHHERLHLEVAGLIEGCDPGAFEREVHLHLADVRVGGEWFRADRLMVWWAIKCATARLKHPKIYARWLRARRGVQYRARLEGE